IYSPDDGRKLGLEGMIEEVVELCRPQNGDDKYWKASENWNGTLPLEETKDIRRIARAITLAENEMAAPEPVENSNVPVLGITGTGGAGKSSVTDELVRRFLNQFPEKTLAVISVDPSKKKTGGALLGDRIRMNSIHSPR